MRRFGLLLALGAGFLALSTLSLSAQSNSPSVQSDASFEIRLDAREVTVPVEVEDYRFEKINGLTVKDFRIYEDGVKQTIWNLSAELIHFMNVPDNLGRHIENSITPKGMWAGPDSGLGKPPGFIKYAFHGGGYRWWYMISYVPPPSTEGSCHQIKVAVDRRESTVYARSEYCNTKHSPSDPLKGTKVGEQIEVYASSAQGGKLPISVQAAATFKSAGVSRVSIAVEIPWRALSTYRGGCGLYANVDLLGLVYNKDGTLSTRFSDAAYSPKAWDSRLRGHDCPREDMYVMLPSRYETQVDLPPRSYNLRVVVTDGEEFGRTDVPLTVDSYDGNKLAVSGIVLSKRFTEMAVVWPQYIQCKTCLNVGFPTGEVSTAPNYVPLVSNGIGFTPAGDTNFPVGDQLLTYFEVNEPLLAAGQVKVSFRMRVIDAKTGQLQVGTDWRSADAFAHPGSSIIPIVQGIATDKLPKSAYRLEVQASDSAGKQTAWRAAVFTVE